MLDINDSSRYYITRLNQKKRLGVNEKNCYIIQKIDIRLKMVEKFLINKT